MTPSSAMPGFESHDIGVGVVTGIRRWKVTPSGRLSGMSVPELWRPGENVAVCGGNPEYVDDRFGQSLMTPRDVKEPLDCGKCGYYAYFGSQSAFSSGDYGIDGVIEAYGHVVIGTKGFRAQRARIVALHASVGSTWAISYYYGFGGSKVAWPVVQYDPVPQPMHDEVIARIRGQYPDVPLYDTAEAMLAAHPTDPLPPEPEHDPSDFELVWATLPNSTCTCRDCMRQLWAMGSVPRRQASREDDPSKAARDAALKARKNRSTGPAKPRPGQRKTN